MKLVHLTSISFTLCLLGMLALVIAGIESAERLQSNQREISRLLSLDARIDNFSAASDSLLLSGADPALWQAYLMEAQSIQAQLRELSNRHPAALKAKHRIGIITNTVENEILADSGNVELPGTIGEWNTFGPLELPVRSHMLINQVANHGIALDTALDDVIQERLQYIRSTIIQIGLMLAVATMLFAALAVFAFALIHRRIVTPMRELTNTIEAIREGNMNQRAEVLRNDELGEMAGTLNRMLDHRQAQEEELVNHENLLSESQRIASLGSWQLDLRTNRLEWSNETYRILGVTPEDFTPGVDSFAELVHPEDLVNLKTRRETALQKRQPYDMTFRIIRPGSGEVRYVHERAEAQYDKDGQTILFAGTLQDVTERKQVDARLIQYEKLVEGSANLCGICNSEYVYLYVNQAYCEFAGRERSDIEGRHLQDILGEEYFEQEVKPLVDRCMNGDIQRYETTRNHAVLGKRYLLANYFPIEASNNTYFVAAVITDITDLKVAESALEEQSRLLTIAGRMAQLGGWSVELPGEKITWSDVVAGIHGLPHGYSPTLEEVLNFYTPESRERIESLFTACTEEGKPYDEVLQIVNANGEYLWVRTAGEPVYDNSGKIVRVQGAFQDITARLKLEEQLRQSQRLEAVGQLTGGVAHDFNNLLTVIMGNAETLSEQLASNTQQLPLVEMISDAAQRGAQLTGQLLAYARRQPLNPKAVDVNRLLSGISKLMKGTLGEHVEINLIEGTGLWLALVDAAQLENAILNLCINARDAMPQGGNLTIETRNVHLEQDYVDQYTGLQPGQYVQLAVSDTGEGIPKELLEHVFEPFFTTKEVGKGTGLGLAMVYGFVKQSNGHVNIYSEPGQGTSIKLYLPRCADTEQPPVDDETRPDAESAGGTETILLVEDDDLVRQHVHTQLMSLGYEVLAAENGPEALEILGKREQIDLLFTDIIMPGGMSGHDLAEEARKLRPDLKVLYTSGYTENTIVHQGRLDPGVRLLTKPYRRAELAKAIRTALDS